MPFSLLQGKNFQSAYFRICESSIVSLCTRNDGPFTRCWHLSYADFRNNWKMEFKLKLLPLFLVLYAFLLFYLLFICMYDKVQCNNGDEVFIQRGGNQDSKDTLDETQHQNPYCGQRRPTINEIIHAFDILILIKFEVSNWGLIGVRDEISRNNLM